MSVKSIDGVAYGRATPHEWDDLVQDTRLLSRDPMQPDNVIMRSLAERLDVLDNESLDENRYYGLGIAMCGLMRAISAPDTRTQLVTDIADSLQACHIGRYGLAANKRGLDIGEPERVATAEPFKKIILAVNRALPAEIRLLTDGLQTLADYRGFDSRFPGGQLLAENFFETTMANDPVVRRLGDTVSDASRIVLNVAAEKYYNDLFFRKSKQGLPAIDGDRYYCRETFSDLLAAGLDKAQLAKVAMSAAAIRFDEFKDNIREMIQVDDQGDIKLDRSVLKPEDELKPAQEILHIQRLTCPALQVRGLIPAMLQIIPDAVVLADTRIGS